MKFAKRVYAIAGVYGLLVIFPQYFLEAKTGRDFPPAITHPEYFYGFVGLAIVWQVAFLVMASDPFRFRPLMPITVLEKASFGLAAIVLIFQNRIPLPTFIGGMLDLVLGGLFLAAYLKTPEQSFGGRR
jgi:hypothetical protein